MIDLRSQLPALASPGGGWGYSPGQPPHLEPTCLALLALSSQREKYAEAVQSARAWLLTCSAGDGTYRLARGRREAAWPTALALVALAELGEPAEALDAGARALLALRGRRLDFRGEENVNDVNGLLVGWPWAEGNFSWVEPTAWAVLALRRLGQCDHPRVKEGQELLLDRVLEVGGVNYGNRRILGLFLDPIPTPTALALIALQGRDDARVARSVEYLRRFALTSDDVEHLAWAALALGCYRGRGVDDDTIAAISERLRAGLEARQATAYLRPAPLRLALAALALEGGNPFLLTAAPRPALAEGKLGDGRASLGERVRGWFQGVVTNALGQLRPLDPQSEVHVAPVTGYNADIADTLLRQYDHFRDRVPLKGKRVVLKPNLVEYHRDKVINTEPRLVAAVIELCQREGAAEVIVAEGPGHWRNVEYLVAASGLGEVLRTYKVQFVDLNNDEPVKRANLGGLTKLDHLFLSETIATAEVVISLPKMKTHHWAVATLSLKNLFGILPGTCYGWPKNELHWRGIDNSIVDIALTRTPDLAIVDGIIGMEGDGPLNGTPKQMGVVIMGSDLVAVDATCCRLMQLDPAKVGYLVMGARKKLGHLDEGRIRQLGETIAGRRQSFDTVEHFKGLWVGRPA